MARRSQLEDEALREMYLAEIAGGADLTSAADAIGMTRRAVQNYRAQNPDFEDAVARAQAVAKAATIVNDDAFDDGGESEDDDGEPGARRPTLGDAGARRTLGLRKLPADLREFVFSGGLGLTAEDYIKKCVAAAENPDHRASATCHKILAALLIEPLVLSLRQQVTRSAAIDDQRAGLVPKPDDGEDDRDTPAPSSNGVILVRLPRNGSEAPGRGPQERVVLEAEVVDGRGEM